MKLTAAKLQDKFFLYKIPIVYTLSSLVKAFATMVSGFIVAKFVEPTDFGLWTTLSLLTSYAILLQGGVINGLSLELPLAFGEGNIQKGNSYISVSHFFTLISGAILFLAAVSVFLFYSFGNQKERMGFIGVSIVTVLTFFQNFLLSTFRSNNQFLRLSYIQIFEAILNLFALIFVFYYAYYGMVLKSVIVMFLYVTALYIYRPIKVQPLWDKSAFLHLLKVGLPIFGLAYVEVFASTVDKILLVKFSDFKSVGIYSFAFYSFAFTTLFSSSLASYVYPKLTYKYGESKNKLLLWQSVKKLTLLLVSIQIPFGILGYFIIPVMVSSYFPQYAESTLPMQILLFAGIFKGSAVGSNVLWSMKKWKFMVIYQVGYAVLLILGSFLLVIVCSNKVVGVALGLLFACLISLVIGIYLCYEATVKNK